VLPEDAARPAAWIYTPPPEHLPDDVRAEIGDLAAQIGFVPNIARLLAVTPRHFVGWWRYFDDLMRGPSNLTKTQREMIAVVVSVEARCPYLNDGPCGRVAAADERPGVRRFASNYRQLELEPRDRAMLDFAVKLTRTPDECDKEDLATRHDVGYSDEDILHIAELTAIFNYNGRLANAMGLLPNVEYHDLGRHPDTS
jgi:uncharacterized peroxidase-related enzyme